MLIQAIFYCYNIYNLEFNYLKMHLNLLNAVINNSGVINNIITNNKENN